MKLTDIFIAVVIFVIILLLILPLQPFVLDMFLIVNITTSVVILLLTIYSKEALSFSVFPPLLLIITLFRLSLNISATRLILGNAGQAGKVISTFGGFVIGGNLVVGIIIFAIIMIIQFLVITKGAERVAEVAARFALDALPGKQMSIDADLNAGLCSEEDARQRRLKVQREADFYGAMDGASKFVKGEAIVGVLITIINIVGGMILGMTRFNLPLEQVVDRFTLVTVGNGLVSQIPALLVSTATGIIVTRAASQNNLGRDISSQMFSQPLVLMISSGMVFLLGLIPGLPKIPIFLLAAVLLWIGYTLNNASKQQFAEERAVDRQRQEGDTRQPENVMSLLNVDPIEVEFGYGLIPLVDASSGGDLLDRVIMIRRQCALDLGMIIPVIRLRDNIALKTNEYVIKIKGNEVSRGEVLADHYLAMNPELEDKKDELHGIETVEPAFGLPALWISKKEKERAELLGYTIVSPSSVVATHLSEVLKRHGHELLSRQQVQDLLDNMGESQPALVKEVTKLLTLGEIQKVLVNLLKESIPIRDLTTILEVLTDYGALTKDTDLLTEYVRQGLRRTITSRHIPDNKAHVLTLDPKVEQHIAESIKKTEQGSYVALEPDYIQKLVRSLKIAIEKMTSLNVSPIILTSPIIRSHFRKLIEHIAPDLVVLSYNEIESNVEIHSDGVITV